MLETLNKAFSTSKIQMSDKVYVPLHSHTSKDQGLFLQQLFDDIKPKKTLEVGLAYGISAMFILEKHKEYNHDESSHIVIEPFPWGGAAVYNIKKEGLFNLLKIFYQKSHDVLPMLYQQNERIQYAYVDTTKVFDVVLQDFYFIDKLLDVNGIIIFDDCNGGWPGVQRVARFVNVLPHYRIYKALNKSRKTIKKKIAEKAVKILIKAVPFKDIFYPSSNFKTDAELGLNYSCIAFQKIAEDSRNWDWDKTF